MRAAQPVKGRISNAMRTPPPLEDIQCFLLDMDGTVYLGPSLIPGAAEFIETLRSAGRRFLYFTNNPTATAGEYARKLAGMGIDAAPEQILTAGEATARYLADETPYRRVLALGTPSFLSELERAGILPVDEDPEAVVLAFDKTLTYAKLERACLLLREGLPYIATNPDLVCPTEYGYIPDCGAIAALLEAAANRRPKFIGKPYAEMVRMGLRKLDARPEETAMVGDRLYTDMRMAYDAGIVSILVLSGETGPSDLEGAERRPDHVFASVAELAGALRACV